MLKRSKIAAKLGLFIGGRAGDDDPAIVVPIFFFYYTFFSLHFHGTDVATDLVTDDCWSVFSCFTGFASEVGCAN